jgi:bla regulator protein blaR1
MKRLFFDQVFSENFFRPLCWTLLHSLWIGLVAALLAGCVIHFTRRSRAVVRYNLLTAILFLFLAGCGIIFLWELFLNVSNGQDTAGSEAAVAGTILNEQVPVDLQVASGFTERFTGYFNTHAPFVVLVWFLFFFAKSIKLFAGLHYVHCLRYQNNTSAEDAWIKKLEALSRQLGMQEKIRFLESELIKVPVVIGLLKPAILVPVGLLTQLPPEQVEAILLHELAHIRRKDFLVNLLESIAETIFFFNPALVWLSNRIREEREACCDDVVMQHMPKKSSYVEALVSFQEYQLKQEHYTLALADRKNYLLDRVRRMLTQENKKLSIMEKTFLLIGIAGITAFSVITEQPAAQMPVPEAKPVAVIRPRAVTGVITVSPVITRQDTLPKTKIKEKENRPKKFSNVTRTSTYDGQNSSSEVDATDTSGKKYRIKRINGETTEFSVNGETVPKEKYAEYMGILSQFGERRAINDTERKELMAKKRMVYEEKKKEYAEKRKEYAEERKEKMKDQLEKRKEISKLQKEKMKYRDMDGNRLFRTDRPGERLDMERKMRSANRLRDSLLRKNTRMQYASRLRSNEEIGQIIRDLSANNLVSNQDELSFSLDSKELVVNGQKQPADMHQKLREKYIAKPGDHFSYSKKGRNTSININKN